MSVSRHEEALGGGGSFARKGGQVALQNLAICVSRTTCPAISTYLVSEWFYHNHRAMKDSLRSQTIYSKGTAYDITKYKTFLTKYGIVCPFKGTFVNSRGTAYHIL